MKSVLLVLIFLSLAGCAALATPSFVKEERKLGNEFKRKHADAFSSYTYENRKLFFTRIGTLRQPKLIFIHGTPGSWSHFIRQISDPVLQNKFLVLSADRFGFGQSGPGIVETSIEKQALSLMPLLDQDDPQSPVILVGHSYGGPIVARMAMTRDPRIKSVIILAGPANPELEAAKWFHIVGEWDLVSWLIPTVWRTANREILSLQSELKKMESLWSKITASVVILQGDADKLVNPRNADFMKENIPGAVAYRLPGIGHILAVDAKPIVLDLILKERDKLP